MRCTQLLILHQGIKDLRVQLGAQVEQSHAGGEKKEPGTCIENQSAALLQRTAKAVMPKTPRI